MRVYTYIVLIVFVTLAFPSFVDVGARVDSGVITINTIKGGSYVIVTPDNGEVVMYELKELDAPAPVYRWKKSAGGGDILSTGSLAFWSERYKNYLFVAPYDVGLRAYVFDDYKATEVLLGGAEVVDWGQVMGGIAAFTADEDEDTVYFIVVGANTEGELKVGLVMISSSDYTNASYDEITYNLGAPSYSTLAVSDVIKGSSGSARIYVGTDEEVKILDLSWDFSFVGGPVLNLTPVKSFGISGKAQSGFAVGGEYVYFLTFSISRTYFYVLDKDGKSIKAFPIDPPPGESTYSWMTTSPVVLEDGYRDIVYFVVGRSVYKFDSSNAAAGVQKYADIGDPVRVSPVIAEDWMNPGNNVLFVVSTEGRVYKVGYMDVEEVTPNDCAGKGQVFSPPTIKDGKIIFGMSTFDGGAICSVDVSEYAEGVAMEGWPIFGYKGGRTQTYMVNPPFTIPLYLRAEFEDGTSADGKVGFDFITADMEALGESAVHYTFNEMVYVRHSVVATACADQIGGEDIVETIDEVVFPGTDVQYVFSEWSDGNPNLCRSENIVDIEIWKAEYSKYYAVKRVLINISGSVEEVLSEEPISFVKEGEIISLSPTPGYEFVRWEIYTPDGSIVSTDPSYSFNVKAPTLIKEYVRKIYGLLWFKYPKRIFEPSPGANTFEFVFQLRYLRPLEYGGAEATGVNSLEIGFTSSIAEFLPIEATVIEASYDVFLDPDHVEFNTSDATISVEDIGGGDRGFLVLVGGGVIIQATDLIIATLTVEYGDGTDVSFPIEMDDYITPGVISGKVGDGLASGGLLKVMTSKYGHEYSEVDADASGLDYLPEVKLLGDFTGDNCVDFADLREFLNVYGLKKGDPDWKAKYDIGPREGFSPPPDYYPGFLILEPDRPINFDDFRYLAVMYGYGDGCNNK